ncbi:LCP family protein [Pseudonocardia dioxanivorans]|uniref:LCP family protein n=1 Tax=Pseudonocardia dioxanivorans TaxID=240495 RepID=UPI0003067668|nr:LCP family protein [Pseudonocardia dioxanivorans]
MGRDHPAGRRPADSGERTEPERTARAAQAGLTRAGKAARIITAALSVVVLVVTGYGWAIYRQLGSSLTTSDVLGAHQPSDGATDILLVGLDSRTDAAGRPLPQQLLDQLNAGPDEGTLNTDTLILIRIPNDPAKPTTAISIPRDSYVDIPGYGTHKINSAYARAGNAEHAHLAAQGVSGPELEQRANQAGRRNLIATVQQLTGASIDHYAEINLAGFAQITQAVGGVPVCLNSAVKDSYSGVDLPAGPQTLQGAPALAFVRQRHGLPRGDLDRIVRQQAFLASLAHKVLSAGTLANPGQLSALIDAISHYVVLDQGWDLLAFADQVQGLTGGNISFRTIPTGNPALRTPSDGLAVQVDPALVQGFVAGLSGPTTPPAPAPGPGAPSVTVDVRNATARTGLGAGVQNLLDDHGFIPGELANAPTAASSAISAPAGTRAAADQIAALLGGLAVHTDNTLPAGHIRILLGRDYRGPDGPGQQSPPTPTSRPTTPGDDAPGASSAPPITAAGVPCIN